MQIPQRTKLPMIFPSGFALLFLLAQLSVLPLLPTTPLLSTPSTHLSHLSLPHPSITTMARTLLVVVATMSLMMLALISHVDAQPYYTYINTTQVYNATTDGSSNNGFFFDVPRAPPTTARTSAPSWCASSFVAGLRPVSTTTRPRRCAAPPPPSMPRSTPTTATTPTCCRNPTASCCCRTSVSRCRAPVATTCRSLRRRAPCRRTRSSRTRCRSRRLNALMVSVALRAPLVRRSTRCRYLA